MLEFVKDLAKVVEIVREQSTYGMRYNRQILDYLRQQIENTGTVLEQVTEQPTDEEALGYFTRLEATLERGRSLIEDHTNPFEAQGFHRVSDAAADVETICQDLKKCLEGLELGHGMGKDVKIDRDHIAKDKLYMEWYLHCILEDDQEQLEANESVRRELVVLRSENTQQLDRMLLVTESAISWGRSIGQGQVGEVFQGRWGGQTVAVKKLTLHPDRQPTEVLADFLTEAEMNVWLKHPHVVDCYAATKSGCLVMELAQRNLQGLCLEVRQLGWDMKIKLLTHAARGLKHLHSKGIVHCGVKSPNFLVLGEDLANCTVKMAEFGLAPCVMGPSGSSPGRPFLESDPWTAPDVVEETAHDFTSDVFSFGVVMYEVGAQSLPYGKMRSDRMLRRKQAHGDPCSGLHKCPEPLKSMMRQCIDPVASDRPSMEQVCDCLEGLLRKVTAPPSVQAAPLHDEKVLELKYSVPEGIDPETLATFANDLESFEIDFALEKVVSEVPSYVPEEQKTAGGSDWRPVAAVIPASSGDTATASSAGSSMTISLTGTSLLTIHERSVSPRVDVSSYTKNWVKARGTELKHAQHDTRSLMYSTTEEESHGTKSVPSEANSRLDQYAGTDEEGRTLIFGTAYEGQSQNGVPSNVHQSGGSGSEEGTRMLHSTAFEGNFETSAAQAGQPRADIQPVEGRILVPSSRDGSECNTDIPSQLYQAYNGLGEGPSTVAWQNGRTQTVATDSSFFSAEISRLGGKSENQDSKYTTHWILLKEEEVKRHASDRTLLHNVAHSGDLKLVEVLVHQYVNLDIIDKYGRTPLHEAAQMGRASVASLLLENGSDPTIQDIGGETPLHFAACNNRTDVVRLLLDSVKENKDLQNSYGNTALHVAAMKGHLEVVALLLEREADPYIKNNNRKRPQDLGDSSVKEVFRDYVCYDQSPPARRGSVKGIKRLFAKG